MTNHIKVSRCMDRLRKAPYENSYEIGSQARDNTRKRQGEMAPRARRRGGGMRGPGQVKRKKFCVPSQGWWDAGRTPPPPYRSPYASPYRTPPPVLLYGMRSGNGRQGPRCGGRVRLVREEGRDVSSQYGREGVGTCLTTGLHTARNIALRRWARGLVRRAAASRPAPIGA